MFTACALEMKIGNNVVLDIYSSFGIYERAWGLVVFWPNYIPKLEFILFLTPDVLICGTKDYPALLVCPDHLVSWLSRS